ncbi:photosynthetic NDH subunit of lumenal location 2, chloroplastic [Beta vulgaris subsp. vulgaris]|uniref:photosynthetic NDH subunit of lumenal location 2, chloroplastic n=1 Tax=Beta vulgaris subsp. vulgaris TaxID=3555 RepID=UPI00053F9788|nr:photosynthetic NDH subunit of lumenal location 2, chloroplastic [Beta vulgaris subsp. vulgaris]
MTTILNPTISLLQTKIKKSPHYTHQHVHKTWVIRSSVSNEENQTFRRKFMVSTLLGGLGLNATSLALKAEAEELKWGTRSFIWEHFFEPGLSPEDAVARMKNTAEGLHSLRHMLETMSWRYVIFYIRLKQAYLKQDMKSALVMVPDGRKQDYVNAANELVDNMAEFDYYVRTPKVYESYVFYEKTLKSIDNLLGFLA